MKLHCRHPFPPHHFLFIKKDQNHCTQVNILCVGPAYPDYAAVCCDSFRNGSVCEETFGNVIATIPNTVDLATCQQNCQVIMAIIPSLMDLASSQQIIMATIHSPLDLALASRTAR